MRQIVLDTETTGLSPAEGHRITEIGCVEIINRRITDSSFQTYINPEREIDEGAIRISGLTNDFLQDKPKFFAVVEDFFTYIKGAEVIIHNAPFDVAFLNYELRLMQHKCSEFANEVKIFDTLEFARRLHPGQRNSLDALCKRYRIDNSHRSYHGALLDAKILAEVYLAMTAGQTNFMLTHEEEEINLDKLEVTKKKDFIKRVKTLKIIQANAEELAEHKKYIEHIKKKSEGVCLWEQE
jgi:DNA polymerase-3 subunit epsilon